MINRILNDIEDETCYYVGTNGCLYQDLEKEELYAIKNEIDKYKEVIDKAISNNQRIIDYGFDYDGFNNVEDLKKLIDMLVDYARKNKEILEKKRRIIWNQEL